MNNLFQLSLTACVAFALDYQFAFLSGDYRRITPAGTYASFGQHDPKNIPQSGNFQAMFYENGIIYSFAPAFSFYLQQPDFRYQTPTSAMWAYNISSNLWKWVHGPNGTHNAEVRASPSGVFHPSNLPSARYFSATAYDSLGKMLYLYGGLPWNSFANPFWVYSVTLNQWAFINSNGSTPGSGIGAIAIDEAKRVLYLFGEYDGLWQCNLITRAWNFTMYASSLGNAAVELGKESPANYPGSNSFPALVFHQRTGQMYLFGGDYYGEPFDYFWRYNTTTMQWALLYGSIPRLYSSYGGEWTRFASRKGVPNINNYIGRRSRCGMTIDQATGMIYIAGGWETDEIYNDYSEFYYYSDLWSYNTTSGIFTWLAGDYEPNSVATLDVKGVPSAYNNPGAVIYPKITVDPTTKSVYILGGTGMCSTSNALSNCNALWVAVDVDLVISSTSTTSSTSAFTFQVTSSSASSTSESSEFLTTSYETTPIVLVQTTSVVDEITTTTTARHDINLTATESSTTPSINNPAALILSGGNTSFLTIAMSAIAAIICGTLSSLTVVMLYECGCCAKLSKRITNNNKNRNNPPAIVSSGLGPSGNHLMESPPLVSHVQFSGVNFGNPQPHTNGYTAYTNYNGPTLMTQTPGELNIPGFLQIEPHEFRLDDQIAKGGNSHVFQAVIFAPNLNLYAEKVVGKVLFDKDVSFMRPHARDAFFQEIALMNMLKNEPHIAKIVAFCSSGPVALFMKYYQLGSLRDALDNHLFARSKVMAQICLRGVASGIQSLHRNGVAHYDLKPDNILLEESADGSILALLTDFGISRVFQEKILQVKAFNAAIIRGLTYNYAAPEVIRAFKGSASAPTSSQVQKADIYAFALIAYEILAGKTAWSKRYY